jgi:hypothetical protein
VAYELYFPSHAKIHLFFHVSYLKTMIGTKCQTQTSLPELDEEGSIWLHPQVVLDQCEHHLYQRTIKEVLVQWKRYNSSRCHLGANYHSIEISSSQALRTRLFSKGEGMLGT